MNNKILCVGPLPPPYNGQAVAFSYLKELKSTQTNFIFYNTQRFRWEILNYLGSIFGLTLQLVFSHFEKVYFIGARSKWGFLRQLPLFFIANIKRVKLINHLHGADFKSFYQQSGFLKPLVKLAYNSVHTSIVLLPGMKKEFEDFPKMHITVIPNAVGHAFDRVQPTFPKSKKVLYLSNLLASKGIFEYLEAAEQLLLTQTDININIAGDFVSDHLMSARQVKELFIHKLTQLKKQFGDQINYLGVVTGIQKTALLAQNAILVLPTYYPTEALPIAILEAMTSGNAIVATKHNYLEEFLSTKNGMLIPPKSVPAIVDAVKKLFESPKKLIEKQRYNAKIAHKEFNLTTHLEHIKTCLEQTHEDAFKEN